MQLLKRSSFAEIKLLINKEGAEETVILLMSQVCHTKSIILFFKISLHKFLRERAQ